MKATLFNPFITSGYISPEYFCDREKETTLLLKAIQSKRNITLISLRRMGKTGLLKQVQHIIEKKSALQPVIYVDLLPTMNAYEMLNNLSSALIRVKQKEKNFIEKLIAVMANLRPRLAFDSLTGQPTLELKIDNPSEIGFGLESLLKFMSTIKNDIVFMFDEFQQISQYPEKNIEQILRSVIQSFPKMVFIFSGSNKHMLEAMFSTSGRPFYQSTELMYLNTIEEEAYRNFIQHKFQNSGKKIGDDVLGKVFEWTRLHTFYVQFVCNKIYETHAKIIDFKLLNETFYQILAANEPLYANYRNLLPGHQFRLLQALAATNGVSQPTSGSFIRQFNLTSASSVKTSLNALSSKEMIIKSDSKWMVYDVFFSRWLEYQYGSGSR